MGVQGLWEVLGPAGQSISLTKIAVVDGFENNISGRRAYRIGIDASIWYQHAEHSTKEGANPELRLLFFRLAKLTRLPWLVLFVFDGRERPKVKRGSRMGKSGSHNLTQKFKSMIECFGMEWRMARGEAEAELACLNARGIIDAIITDDVDALVFGARTLIKNPSLALTGNRKNPATDASGNKSEHHAMVFTSDRIGGHPSIGLTRSGLILFAMLSGGDYDKGAKGIGPKIALGLARCGFGDRLVAAYRQGEAHFRTFLPQWRTAVNTELLTNSTGLLPHRCPGSTLQSNWPDVVLLDAYVNPVCSGENNDGTAGLALRDRTDMSLPRLAKFCEDHFDEWGHRSRILERFHNFMWDGAVFQVLRRAALEADEKEKAKRSSEGRPLNITEPLRPTSTDGIGTAASLVQRCLNPPKKDLQEDRFAAAFVRRRAQPATASAANIPDAQPLIEGIVGARQHLQTDKILEYRVVIRCKQLEDLAGNGIVGKHPEPPASGLAQNSHNLPDEDSVYGTGSPKKAAKPIDRSMKRMWIAASIMRQVHPRLVEQFETEGPSRAGRRRKQVVAANEEESDDDDFRATNRSSSPVRPPSQRIRAPAPAVPAPARGNIPGTVCSSSTNAPQMAAPLPSRPLARPHAMYNVGDINFEKHSNKNTFLFTFTDPCDPAMLVSDNEPGSFEEFVEGSSHTGAPAPSIGSSGTNTPHYGGQALASGFVDLDEDEDDLPPSVSTAAQEALISRIRGNSSGGTVCSQDTPLTRRRNNRAVPPPPVALPDDPLVDEEAPSLFTTEQEAMINRALGLAGPSASRKGKGKQVARAPTRRAHAPTAAGSTTAASSTRAHATSLQGHPRSCVATQGASGSGSGPSRRTAGVETTRGNASSISAPSGTFGPLDDDPLPAMFSAEQEAAIDRALGIFGGASEKRTKASVPRKRPAGQAAGVGSSSAQAKRHKTGSSFPGEPASVPHPTATSSQSVAKPRQLPRMHPLEKPTHASQPAASRATSSYDDDVIDISDTDTPSTYAEKRSPMARRTNAWDTMPSSSQESRLDDIPFDFDLS